MTERTAHETQISVRLGPITGLCRLCRVCPDRAERGAKGRREWAWRGLWGLFWAFLLYYGPLSRITRFGGACWVARTEPVEPTARSGA